MDTLTWKDTLIVDSSGAVVGQASTPFDHILLNILAWLTNDTSPDARQLQRLYQPVHKNYTLSAAAFQTLSVEYTEAHLESIRHDFNRLRKRVSVQVTTEEFDHSLMGEFPSEHDHTAFPVMYIPPEHDHTASPVIYFTTLSLETMAAANSRAEQNHILLAIYMACFRELAHLLGRWKFGRKFLVTPERLRATAGSRVNERKGGDEIEQNLMDGGSRSWYLSGRGGITDALVGFRYSQLRFFPFGYYALADEAVERALVSLSKPTTGFCNVPLFSSSAIVRVDSAQSNQMLAEATQPPVSHLFLLHPDTPAMTTDDHHRAVRHSSTSAIRSHQPHLLFAEPAVNHALPIVEDNAPDEAIASGRPKSAQPTTDGDQTGLVNNI